jgi:RNA polymerase sigma factor (sigma-70 family)
MQMDATVSESLATSEQDRAISAAVRREGGRLRNFIRRRVLDIAEADDVFQDVLCELVAAYRSMLPIEQVGAWLMRVARHRIIDRFRKKKTESLARHGAPAQADDEDPGALLEDVFPSMEPGPESEAVREMLLEQIEAALDELPREQREVFLAHELEGTSFKELAERSGVGVNTLLSRKRYAVLALREHLRSLYDEWLETGE